MSVQFVVKVSKFCNLRCGYCYEHPELGNPDRMSIEQIQTMFEHIATYYQGQRARREGSDEIECQFIWHGGEPLIQDTAYYLAIFAEQKRLLSGIKVVNLVQTNLTMLDESRIDLLKNHFDGVGVSLDVSGDLRLNVAGKPSQRKVLENMARLQHAGIVYGCISVLTRRSLPHVERMFRFYERLDCSFRILPLFQGAYEAQHLGYEVTGAEVLAALCRIADLWFASDTRIWISPIAEQLRELLMRRSSTFVPTYYDRRDAEQMILVNTNGELYSQADAYNSMSAWGNIFRTSLAEILSSEPRARSVREAEARMAGTCLDCEYFGACNGFPIAEDNRRYADTMRDNTVACVVERGLFRHLERRLQEAQSASGDRLLDRLGSLSNRDVSVVQTTI